MLSQESTCSVWHVVAWRKHPKFNGQHMKPRTVGIFGVDLAHLSQPPPWRLRPRSPAPRSSIA
eukprot:2544365-Rhodomonas_salina.5